MVAPTFTPGNSKPIIISPLSSSFCKSASFSSLLANQRFSYRIGNAEGRDAGAGKFARYFFHWDQLLTNLAGRTAYEDDSLGTCAREPASLCIASR